MSCTWRFELYNESGEMVAFIKKLAVKQVRSKGLLQNLEITPSTTPAANLPEFKPKPAAPAPPVFAIPEQPAENRPELLAPPAISRPELDTARVPLLKEAIEYDLRQMVAELQHKLWNEVSPEAGFYDQGLDSTQLIEMVRMLETKIQQQLYPTLLFEYTNIRELADYLALEYSDFYPADTVTQPFNGQPEPQTPVSRETVPATHSAGQIPSLQEDIENDLRRMVAEVQQKPWNQVSPEAGFYDQGLDSTQLIEMVRMLENKIQQQLYPTLLFEYTNIRELAEYLYGEYGQFYTFETSNAPAAPVAAVQEIYYQYVWEEAEPTDPANRTLAGNILLFGDDEAVIQLVIRYFNIPNRSKARIIRVTAGKNYRKAENDHYQINPKLRDDYQQLFSDLQQQNLLPNLILYLWPCQPAAEQPTELDQKLNAGIYPVFYLNQALMLQKPKGRVRLLYIYQNTQSRDLSEPSHAAVSGFAKAIYFENPKFDYRVIEIDAALTTYMPEILDHEIGNDLYQAEIIRYEAGRRLLKTLREITPGNNIGTKPPLKENGVYIITGGAGGLGLIFAGYLIQKANANLILVGRSELSPEKQARIHDLQRSGGTITYIKADISKREQVTKLITTVKSHFQAINGVIHGAGLIRDALLVNKDPEEFRAVLAPKIQGTVNLDEALQNEPLDFFVMFSSIAAVFGNVGQTDYAYANCFMDAYAARREALRKQGARFGKTLSFNWPFWREGGMHGSIESEAGMEFDTGMVPLTTAQGLKAFETGLGLPVTQLVLLSGSHEKMKQSWHLAHRAPRDEDLPRNEGTESRPDQIMTGEVGEDIAAGDEIAIIGLSGRYPRAKNIFEFWEVLKNGTDCITEIPGERWDYRPYYNPDKDNPGTTYSKWGGFLEDINRFDPLFFSILPRNAMFIDPQERLFLETVWQAIEDAGYTRAGLGTDKVGVFAGVMWEQFQLYETEANGKTIPLMAVAASIANHVSFFFDFHGPSITLDTMCSSSLTTVHLACESIKRGESDLAIASGVNLTLHPNKYLSLSGGKMVSSDGRCRSFGEGGDGYVPGEGVGAVLLKPFSKALADHDHIYAVIRGSSINHGGRTSGYSVPNPNAQADLLLDVYQKANIDPRTISYIEAHGTGTSLGDPIEIQGLTKVFRKYTGDTQFCAIGSVKSNIGHLESAAGIAGLTKVLLQMQHQQLVPSLHSGRLNPNIDFDNSPFVVQQDLAEWPQPIVLGKGQPKRYPRRAGISAFGGGGANAHIILEEFTGPRRSQARIPAIIDPAPRLMVFSAKTEDQLQRNLRQFRDFIADDAVIDYSLDDIAYTLQTGREAMESRLALIAADKDELILKIDGYLSGQTAISGLYSGNQEETAEPWSPERSIRPAAALAQTLRDHPARLAELWVNGILVDWESCYENPKPFKVSLPAYCFAGESYWVPLKVAAATPKSIEPLIFQRIFTSVDR